MTIADGTSARRASPNLTKELILEEAARLFAEKGYAAATTRQLAERLDVTRASLYYHVDSKEDLLHQICVESLTEMRRAVDAAIDPSDSAIQQLRTLIKTHLIETLRRQVHSTTMLLEMRALDGVRLREVLALRDAYDRLVDDILRRAKDEGAIRADIDVRTLSLALLNLVNWTVVWFRPSGRQTAEQLARQFADVFINGARAQGGQEGAR
jgi:TetR/AcrR family transcriptional regulator, cholesterol catabolism regulator